MFDPLLPGCLTLYFRPPVLISLFADHPLREMRKCRQVIYLFPRRRECCTSHSPPASCSPQGTNTGFDDKPRFLDLAPPVTGMLWMSPGGSFPFGEIFYATPFPRFPDFREFRGQRPSSSLQTSNCLSTSQFADYFADESRDMDDSQRAAYHLPALYWPDTCDRYWHDRADFPHPVRAVVYSGLPTFPLLSLSVSHRPLSYRISIG